MMGRILGLACPDACLISEHVEKDREIPEDASGVEDHRLWWNTFSYPGWDGKSAFPPVEVPVASDDAIRSLRDQYLKIADGRRLIVKNPSHVLYPDIVRAMFPDAMFVYCVRNPWPTLQSMIRKGHENFLLRSERAANPSHSLFLRAAIGWADANAAWLQHHDEKWIVADYDRIVESPQQSIGELCDFLGIPEGEGRDKACSVPRPSSHDYYVIKEAFRTTPDRFQVVQELKAGCQHFGYPLDPFELTGSLAGHVLEYLTRKVRKLAA
ncbi:MAG: sulfotransferase [Planctomycetaceae bacterium]|nr:sulfotransferase [Planctomycetaceae bacterium]